MLINISNHPISEWSEQQIDEATRLWGGVVDVAFPEIDASASKEEMDALARLHLPQYVSLIEQYEAPSAFHIMGEMVYCFHIVNALKAMGYVVVASTSKRDVRVEGSNKIVRFTFEQFRAY